MSKRPIDSFIQYFLDIKPYHTKILEVVEQYKFRDDLNVTINETLTFLEKWANDPLCKGVGYGLDFDDESGFDSLSNCDLFECVGGYGIIFDNSDVLVDSPLVDAYDTGFVDEELGTFNVDGDHRYDTYLQIAATSGSNTLKVRGNVLDILDPHHLFIIAPEKRFDIIETVHNGFYVSGDAASLFNLKREFKVHTSSHNDGVFPVVVATYIPADTRTFIEVPNTDLNAAELGYIVVKSGTKNNGVYLISASSYDGIYTNIILHEDTPLKLIDETTHGVIVLRTAMIAPRRIWLQNDFEGPELIGEYKIALSDYDIDNDVTVLTVESANPILPDSGVGDLSVQLIGYFFGAGFDGFNECGPPNPNNVHIGFTEYLEIEIVSFEAPFYLGLI